MMNLEERIKAYESLLEVYKDLNNFQIINKRFYVHICEACNRVGVDLVDLIELYSLKPDIVWGSGYWFHPTDIQSRVALIKEALSIAKQKEKLESITSRYINSFSVGDFVEMVDPNATHFSHAYYPAGSIGVIESLRHDSVHELITVYFFIDGSVYENKYVMAENIKKINLSEKAI